MKQTTKAKNKVKLPRGLWVGKVRKPAAMWANPDAPEFFDSFYAKYQRAGKQSFMRSLETSNQAEAIGRAKLLVAARESDKWETLREAVDGTRARRGACTMKEWEEAFALVAKARGIDAIRPINNMRLILAVAKGWKQPFDGTRMDGSAKALVHRIWELRADEVNEATKEEFARKCQEVSLGVPVPRMILDTKCPPEVNGTINSTLGNARTMCSRLNRVFEMKSLAIPWDVVDGFCKGSLPTRETEWGDDLPTPEAMREVVAASERLAASTDPMDVELAMVNELLRSAGLRSIEVVNARESWLEVGSDGRTYLVMKHRPDEGWACKTGTAGRLPLDPSLAQRLRARCAEARAEGVANPFLILPKIGGPACIDRKWEDPTRRALIRERHNAFIKGFIGEVRSGQGNHRLRKYLATNLYETHGLKVAMAYLRHSKEAVAFESYIKQREELLPVVTPQVMTVWSAVAVAV
jgi:hypothetical protein